MNLGMTERVKPLVAAVRAMMRDEIAEQVKPYKRVNYIAPGTRSEAADEGETDSEE